MKFNAYANLLLVLCIFNGANRTFSQQIQFHQHQKIFYTEGYGYIPKDFTMINNNLYTTGEFKNQGGHPIITKFSTNGNFEKDLYWDNISASFSKIEKIGTDKMIAYGGGYYANIATFLNLNMEQQEPSLYNKGISEGAGKTISSEMLACTQKGDNLIGVYVNNGRLTLEIRGKDKSPVTAAVECPDKYSQCYFSESKNSIYLFSFYGGDYYAEVTRFDISDIYKPFKAGSTLSNIPYRTDDLVTNITENGFTIISNAYVTSEKDAETVTYSEEKFMRNYEFKKIGETLNYLEQVSEKSFSNSYRTVSYMAKINKDIYLMAWKGWSGISLYLYNSNFEEIHRFEYAFDENMESKLCDDAAFATIKLIDEGTIGFLFPYNRTDALEEPQSSWELFTFKIIP